MDFDTKMYHTMNIVHQKFFTMKLHKLFHK